MFVARNCNVSPYPGECWGFDNGAYRDWVRGQPFNETAYLKSLEKAERAGIPQVAVIPDIVTGGNKSLDFSYRWLDKLPDTFPWYLAVQDGIGPEDVDVAPLAGIFLGGSNSYKATAFEWAEFAHNNELKFHYGRCGTRNKVAHARYVNADSIDSAFPLFSRSRFHQFTHDVVDGPPQVDMFYD